jgi:hypothetical protein
LKYLQINLLCVSLKEYFLAHLYRSRETLLFFFYVECSKYLHEGENLPRYRRKQWHWV